MYTQFISVKFFSNKACRFENHSVKASVTAEVVKIIVSDMLHRHMLNRGENIVTAIRQLFRCSYSFLWS